jgi:hypothetical protein
MNFLTKYCLAAKLGALLVFVGSLAATASWRARATGESVTLRQIEDVVALLHEKGMKFRAVPTSEARSLNFGAYLTTTDKAAGELGCVAACPEVIEEWRGTVFCIRSRRDWQAEVLQYTWGENYLRAGPFFFFGDRDLLAQISAALRHAKIGDCFTTLP